MNKDIKKRIASGEWDLEIASAVIRRRKKANRRIITAGIAASFLIVMTVLVVPVIRTPAPVYDNSFIAEQVSGVYSRVYGGDATADPVEETIDSIILQ
ncbi:MAG TPA: hypothetical protein PKK43_04720 [Spirochaetota bacterium]|nr:hypothetical protein [Spirochaetota bacterium]